MRYYSLIYTKILLIVCECIAKSYYEFEITIVFGIFLCDLLIYKISIYTNEEIKILRQIAYEDMLTKALNRKWLEDNYLNQESKTFIKDGILIFIDWNDPYFIDRNLLS